MTKLENSVPFLLVTEKTPVRAPDGIVTVIDVSVAPGLIVPT